ncbi:phosphate/phosphite/phosphonate ABC transporter substrate-binding protein, partial [Lusitaniella coriacea LEGE 07157]
PTIQATPNKEETFVLGEISDEPTKKIQRFQPLANLLAANLEEFGITQGNVKIVPDLESMIRAIDAGEIDLFFDSLYPAMIISDRAQAKPILRRWKKGQAEYSTIFFTRNDNDIASLSELKGKFVGLEEKISTSGYLLPIAYLLEAGLKPVEKKNDTATVAANEVGYIFTRDDENTVQWVLSGKVIAGAVDSQTFASIPEESRAKLNIIAETEKVPRQLVLIRSDIEEKEREKITSLLENLDTTEEGKKVLEQLEKTKKFDKFPSEQSLEQMRTLYQKVQNQAQ